MRRFGQPWLYAICSFCAATYHLTARVVKMAVDNVPWPSLLSARIIINVQYIGRSCCARCNDECTYLLLCAVAVMLAFMLRGDGEPDTKAFVFATPASLSPSLADAASHFTEV